jgi:hypothetical protein
MSPGINPYLLMNWFEFAKVFKQESNGRLSGADYQELEAVDSRPNSYLPHNLKIGALELPGTYTVHDKCPQTSSLEYFMDGVQRTVLWQHYDYNGSKIPIYLHFSGAVIIKRNGPDAFAPHDAIYKSALLVPSFIFDELDCPGLLDTGAKNYYDLNEIRNKAKVKSRALRQEIEQKIMHRFIESDAPGDSILVKDGNIFGSMKRERVVGLIKTHQTLYLQNTYPEVQQSVWNMPQYHRSMMFSIQLLENASTLSHKVNSFYLRMNEPAHPEMGLLRVEYNKLPAPVEEFSSWLLAEGRVRAKCDRWDRQIYPIQVCENYLRTQLPSSRHIEMVQRSM